MENNIVLETKYLGSISGNFYIKSYQRGYRWREEEVTMLLNDIYYSETKTYWLQPIVVKKENDKYELIDGQQRLTTMFLIYQYIHEKSNHFLNPAKFTIDYETRKQTKEFLTNMNLEEGEKNIDFWHLTQAYKAIDNWFSSKEQYVITKFNEFLNEKVKVIWYEVDSSVNSIELFTRLNIGKIPLTNAELVKAMFLCKDNNKNMTYKMQQEIALQWDNIEKSLHNDRLWFFLTNNFAENYQTRIDLILDLISRKTPENKEKYYTFFKIDEMKKENKIQDIWDKIQQTFLILNDWFNDHEFYHKIGYLIASEYMSLLEIYEMSENQTKKAFLEKIDKKMSERIMIKIDNQWTDILWDYRDETNSIDEYFLHYFRFICDVICYREDDTPMGKNLDEIDLIKEYFSSNLKNVKENVNTFESFFDCWLKITNKIKIKEFFNKYVSNRHEENKIKIDKNIDLFEDCLHNYGLFIENSNRRQFPLGRFVLLYAFIIYLENIENIEEADFIRRIRIINNLINNSVNEISNSNKRDGGNRMPTILKQVDKIILNAQIEVSGENGFNKNQLNEEAKKLIWTKENSEKAEDLYCLEDNDILYGQIDIVGLENYELFNSFNKLFECDWDKIDCALMSIGFYGQESSFARYQLGSSSNITAWSKLFHHGSAKKYENTKQILIKLLESNKNPTNQSLEEIINNYIKKCEEENLYDIRYYYIKYKEFRPGKYGKYYINSRKSIENKPYDLSVMVTEIHVSENSYNPFLKAIDKKNLLSKQYFGQRIINTEYYIISTNEGYILKNNQTDEEIERIEIQQNENKIDKEDRILKCIELENK